jgi:hypothetical protein
MSENQINNRPWLWKKGQSGNPAGRPKGKTMKEWARGYLSRMTDEERDEFMEGIPKDKIWAMAEGNPASNTDITSGGDKILQVVHYGDTQPPLSPEGVSTTTP